MQVQKKMKQRNNKIIIYNDRIVIMNFYVFSDASVSHLMVGGYLFHWGVYKWAREMMRSMLSEGPSENSKLIPEKTTKNIKINFIFCIILN